MRRGKFLILGAVLLVLSPATTTQAAPITVNFSGGVASVDPLLAGTFSLGQTLTGSYTFESTTPPNLGSNSDFAVFDALTSLTFSIGGYTASSGGAPEIQVDDAPAAINDRYAVVSRASQGLTGNMVAGLDLNFFTLRVDDSTNAVFSDALVLPLSPSFSDFDGSGFFVFFGDLAAPQVVSGALTSLSTVPEPTTLLLLGAGLAAVGYRRRRKY